MVKVVDFGLVRTLGSNHGASEVGAAIAGTPLYMAPEAMTAPETVDARADLYAVGAVGYFLLTGKAVFDAPTVIEVCGKHLWEEPLPPSRHLNEALSADLEAIVRSCLAKDREARPSSAAALRAALLACADARRYDPQTWRAWWARRGAASREGDVPAGRNEPGAPVTVTRVSAPRARVA